MQTSSGIINGGPGSKSDSLTATFVYNDTGTLTIGMPVFTASTDAGEYNNFLVSTSLPASAGAYASGTGGFVVLQTSTAAISGNLCCVGIYQPLNSNEAPVQGQAIRVLTFGNGIISATAKAANTASNANAVNVGDVLIVDVGGGQTSVVSNVKTYLVGYTVGIAKASGFNYTLNAAIIAKPTTGATTALINGFVKLL